MKTKQSIKTKQSFKKKRSIAEIFKGCKQAKYIENLEEKIKFSRYLFDTYKHSDEYMTGFKNYERYSLKQKLKGKKVHEPFHGDGTFKKAFKKNGIIPISKKNGDFWDVVFDKKYSKLPILSNPPFSFKYQIMHTLLQLKRNFALVLPERTVINNILPKFKEAYGGEYSIFKLKGKENYYMCKTTNKLKRINTVIIDWKF